MDYLKIGKASDLSGKDRKLYRYLEMFPGIFSWGTLIFLFLLSFFSPQIASYIIIAFDVYWLLLVVFLGIYLLSAYKQMKKNMKINWREKCYSVLADNEIKIKYFDTCEEKSLKVSFDDLIQLIILPTYKEDYDLVKQTIKTIANSSYPVDKIIIVLTVEERAGIEFFENAKRIKKELGAHFRNFLVTVHPDGIEGEMKAKGANQAWGAKIVKEEIIDKEKLDYDKIIVSVFDIDTIIYPDYFFCVAYKFLTVEYPHRASYQPIPIYHNNVWQAPFFARIAASSNTFWQMMQQIRQEKLATYSSHSMTWRALVDVNFWSTTMVSEDSRIFWHCYCYYNGDYRVEPLYYPVSMDITMDETIFKTAKNLYIQQRRWGWGVENLPYLIFNTIKRWDRIPRKDFIGKILIQVYGFHSWATNALIIGLIGWMPILIGGNDFNASVLSANLPTITRTLMTIAMSGLVLSAIVSTLLLPKRPANYSFGKKVLMFFEWILLPISIVFFGSIPGLEAQTRLMLGKYMGFFVTPKKR